MTDQVPERAQDQLVRCVHGAAQVAGLDSPYDTVHFRLFHPARFSGDDAERMTGRVPADDAMAPWPIIVWLPGINIGPESYRWLAVQAARAGFAFVTMALVGDTLPGVVGITPGIDLDAVKPGTYGTVPSAIAVGPLLAAVAELNADGPLAGLLDLDRVLLGGHSGGGSVALQNANPEWFGGVVACATFASHLMAATMLGWPANSVLRMPADVPTLVLAGELDGVMANSADRYGTAQNDERHDPVWRTFDESVWGGRGESHLAVVRGAPHTAMVWPEDHTTARGFLDPPATRSADELLAEIGDAVVAFARATLRPESGSHDQVAELLADTSRYVRSARR